MRWIPLLLALVIGCKGNHPQPVPLPPALVEVATPIERNVTDYQIFTARTEATQTVQIKARVTGYLMKIAFADGAMVKANDILFQIDDRPYKAALDKANADVEYANAAKIKAQAFYDIGKAVQKENSAAISQQELDRRLGGRDEAIAQVKQAQANLETAQLNYNWCTVRSPIDGRVDRHLVDVGALVSENMTQLVNIVSITPIWAYFDVDQNSALEFQKRIKEGRIKSPRTTEAPVQMALVGGSAFTVAGHIDFIANQLDPNTGSIRLRGVFENKDASIASGLFARVRIPTDGPHDALLVNDRAVGTDQGQKFILVVNDKNVVEYREVQVGQLHEGLREVFRKRKVPAPGPNNTDTDTEVEVLKPGDRVIVSGLQRVRPGDTVEPKTVNMQTLMAQK